MDKDLTFPNIKKYLRRLATQREQVLFLWQNYSRNSCLYKLHQNETKIVEGKKQRFFRPFPPIHWREQKIAQCRRRDRGWMDMNEEMFQHLGNSFSFFSLLLPDVHPSQQDVEVLDERSA